MSNLATIDNDTGNAVSSNDRPIDMVSMIERIVMDPSLPLDRLEKMLDMKERMEDRAREDEDRQAKKAYFAAMSKCQAELPVVVKRKKNTHTNSTYADLAAIEEQAMPVIHAHGFSVSFQPDGYNDKGELRIKWEIAHDEGHSRDGVGEIPVDGAGSQGKVNKTGTQAFGSTATYGRRYLLCMLFNISTGDDKDGNREKERDLSTVSGEQLQEIRDLIADTDADVVAFCNMFRIEALPDLLASDFARARDLLQQKKARAAQ